jgi:uncharacterized protein YndB with AHSA1/START domain
MNDTASPTKLVIRRTIDAPQARVFEAWTRPEILQQWFGPSDVTVPAASLDLREGGSYRIEFQTLGGERLVVAGTFKEIREPERLSFTWSWEEDDDTPSHDTLVTLDFRAAGSSTELTLTHENFASQASRDRHSEGWSETLDKLAAFVGAA